jgi:hypothetical protein
MHPSAGLGLTEGQIFQAHFSSRSALNRIYRALPDSLARTCRTVGLPGETRGCLPTDLSLRP